MSVVTALSLVLFVGFVGTGLVGFFGWRQRMREGAVFSPINGRRSADQNANAQANDKQYRFHGAPL
jgi:hypothetical protein